MTLKTGMVRNHKTPGQIKCRNEPDRSALPSTTKMIDEDGNRICGFQCDKRLVHLVTTDQGNHPKNSEEKIIEDFEDGHN